MIIVNFIILPYQLDVCRMCVCALTDGMVSQTTGETTVENLGNDSLFEDWEWPHASVSVREDLPKEFPPPHPIHPPPLAGMF